MTQKLMSVLMLSFLMDVYGAVHIHVLLINDNLSLALIPASIFNFIFDLDLSESTILCNEHNHARNSAEIHLTCLLTGVYVVSLSRRGGHT